MSIGSDFTAMEMGFPGPPLPPAGDLPPGGGSLSIPHQLSFQSLVTTAARTYPYTTDQALLDNWTNARAMKNDTVLTSAFRARIRPTSQLSWHLDPIDDTNPAEAEAAAINTKVIEATPYWTRFLFQLLWAEWYGKFAQEIAWTWDSKLIPGQTVMRVRDYIPINGDKIRQKWSGEWGVLVYGGYPGSWEPTDWGLAHFIGPKEREQYIFHQFEPEDADWMEPRLAGSILGVGLRGQLYWFWWLKQQVMALMMNYLERFSNGLTIFYYAAHDPKAEQQARIAAQQQFSQTALLYPAWNKDGKQINGVERLEVGTASPQLLQNLVTTYFDMVMVRAIRGESPYIGPEGQARGGGDMASLAAEGLDETVKYDALLLQETLQDQYVNVLYKYNTPGIRPGKFKFAIDAPNSQEVLGYAQTLYNMGMSLDEDELYDVGQLTKPRPGSGVVSKLMGLNPAAMSGAPEGMPISGQAGPQMPLQQQQDTEMPLAMRRRQKSIPRRRLVKI